MNRPTLTELPGAERIKRAKAYGKAHGYRGRLGGWIHADDGYPAAQGWWAFYDRNWRAIEAWRQAVQP